MIVDTSVEAISNTIQRVTEYSRSIKDDEQRMVSKLRDSQEYAEDIINRLQSKEQALEAKLSNLKNSAARLESHLSELQSALYNIPPGEYVSVTVKYSDGSETVRQEWRDPYASMRLMYQSEIASVENQIKAVAKQIEQTNRSLLIVKESLFAARSAKSEIDSLLFYTSKYCTDAVKGLETTRNSVVAMKSAIDLYESCRTGRGSNTSGFQTIKKPVSNTKHGFALSGNASYSSSSTGRTREPEISYTNDTSIAGTDACREKIVKVSDEPLCYEVVGMYESIEDFLLDIKPLVRDVNREFRIRTNRKIELTFPFEQNIGSLTADMNSCGYEAVRTALGSRYIDAKGCIYFVHKKQ